MVKNSNEILTLTSLRFVAAFYVFLFHIQIRWPIVHAKFIAAILSQGAIGMSLFFMLSGYVLAYRYDGSPLNYSSYLSSRFARIYPIYFIAAFLTLPFIGVSLLSGSYFHFAQQAIKLAFVLMTNIFLIQAWFPQLFSYWNDSGSWSISVEAFFYVLFPFILAQLTIRTNKQLIMIAGIAYFLALLPGLSCMLSESVPFPVFYAMPIFRLPEFVIGICVYFATKRISCSVKNEKYLILAVLVLICYLGVMGKKLPFIAHDWLVIPVISYAFYILSNSRGILTQVLSHKLFVWCGKISYCFYSFQVLLVLSLVKYHDYFVGKFPIFNSNVLLTGAAFLLLLVVSGLGYHFIEEPMRLRIKMKAKRSAEKEADLIPSSVQSYSY